jgi:hypothetical protein
MSQVPALDVDYDRLTLQPTLAVSHLSYHPFVKFSSSDHRSLNFSH